MKKHKIQIFREGEGTIRERWEEKKNTKQLYK
jgi:hypothetical protein